VLAFGITLVFAGLLTNATVSMLGGIIAIAGAVGWFRDVLPFEAHEIVPVVRGGTGRHDNQTRSRTNGGREGNCGGRSFLWRFILFQRASRAVWPGASRWRSRRCSTAWVSGNGIWYPVNLLAAGFLPSTMTDKQQEQHGNGKGGGGRGLFDSNLNTLC